MPDHTFRCTLITPTQRLLDAEVSYARVPMHDGQRGVMPMTAPIVGKLGPGELRIDFPQGSTRSWYIEGGFMQQLDANLTLLSTGAVAVDELDAEEERAALAQAKARTSSDAEEMDRITDERYKASIRASLAPQK